MPRASVTVFHYPACSTCKKALKWLDAHGIVYELRHIVEKAPTQKDLAHWVRASGKPLRKWLNTSGQSYRALGKAKVDAMTDAEVLAALANDGKLIKRPVVVSGDRVLVGFNAEQYQSTFAR
jgi:arsenate reductase